MGKAEFKFQFQFWVRTRVVRLLCIYIVIEAMTTYNV